MTEKAYLPEGPILLATQMALKSYTKTTNIIRNNTAAQELYLTATCNASSWSKAPFSNILNVLCKCYNFYHLLILLCCLEEVADLHDATKEKEYHMQDCCPINTSVIKQEYSVRTFLGLNWIWCMTRFCVLPHTKQPQNYKLHILKQERQEKIQSMEKNGEQTI